MKKKKIGTAKKRHTLLRTLSVLFGAALLLSVLAAGGVLIYAAHGIDYAADEALFESARGNRTTRLFYNGKSGETATDAPVAVEGYNAVEWKAARVSLADSGLFVPYEKIPSALPDAIVAIEDHRFYEHEGVDILRTGKAALNYVFGFDSRFGGSTVTQQLVKNLSGEDEQSVMRKIREMLRAYHIEKTYSKKEILELYLNIIPLSDGCVGVGSAAEHYFGKKTEDLTLAECASLAAITNSPTYYNPIRNNENNRRRRDVILREMARYGYIDDETAALAENLPVRVSEQAVSGEKVRSWYAETVLSDVVRDLAVQKKMSREAAANLVYGGGLTIYTLMDTDVQTVIERYFRNLAHFDNAADMDYAITVVDPRNGALLGIVGNKGEKTANRVLNYAADALLPPGSALKPLSVYAPALEEGLITWSSVFDDTPAQFTKTADGYRMWPRNASRIYSGLTTAADALAFSKNTVAVKILDKVGLNRSYRYLTENFGLYGLVEKENDENGNFYTDLAEAPLALGQLTHGVTLRELTAAYAAFADGGRRHTSRSYLLVLDSHGRVLLKNEDTVYRAVSEETAAIMTKMLCGVTETGTARTLTLTKRIEVAGKTGTAGTGEQRWFVGYTPYLCIGVYGGSHDGKTATAGNFTGHLKVWDGVATALHAPYFVRNRTPIHFRMPDTVVTAGYCRDSGECMGENCRYDPRGERESVGYFVRGTEPHTSCHRHICVLYDEDGGGVVQQKCFTLLNPGHLKKTALLLVPERDFPTEVRILDAEYVYREGRITEAADPKLPYFYADVKPGHYVGLPYTETPYNRPCPLHGKKEDDMERKEEDRENETGGENEEKRLPFPFFGRFDLWGKKNISDATDAPETNIETEETEP